MFLECYFSSKTVKLKCHHTDRNEDDGEEEKKME